MVFSLRHVFTLLDISKYASFVALDHLESSIVIGLASDGRRLGIVRARRRGKTDQQCQQVGGGARAVSRRAQDSNSSVQTWERLGEIRADNKLSKSRPVMP